MTEQQADRIIELLERISSEIASVSSNTAGTENSIDDILKILISDKT